MEDATTDIINVSNGEINIGTNNNPINEVLISGCVYSRPGEIVAGNNGKINFLQIIWKLVVRATEINLYLL